MEIFKRLEILIGKDCVSRLKSSRVAVFGLGGVGSFAAEALVRSGVGHLAIVDGDVVEPSNFNRQLFATEKALGKFKVDVARSRFLNINSELDVEVYKFFYGAETEAFINLKKYDYVVDAVDDVKAKVLLAKNTFDLGVKIISSMSAGNKLNATQFEVADIFKTTMCPLAKIMRKELKNIGVPRLKVVYSKEKPLKVAGSVIGSTAFVPPVCGFILAGEVVQSLSGFEISE